VAGTPTHDHHLAAGADASQSFSSSKELAKLTAEWPVSRLVDTWNSFAGLAPFDELKPVKNSAQESDRPPVSRGLLKGNEFYLCRGQALGLEHSE
jgi:hypothetical protein